MKRNEENGFAFTLSLPPSEQPSLSLSSDDCFPNNNSFWLSLSPWFQGESKSRVEWVIYDGESEWVSQWCVSQYFTKWWTEEMNFDPQTHTILSPNSLSPQLGSTSLTDPLSLLSQKYQKPGIWISQGSTVNANHNLYKKKNWIKSNNNTKTFHR